MICSCSCLTEMTLTSSHLAKSLTLHLSPSRACQSLLPALLENVHWDPGDLLWWWSMLAIADARSLLCMLWASLLSFPPPFLSFSPSIGYTRWTGMEEFFVSDRRFRNCFKNLKKFEIRYVSNLQLFYIDRILVAGRNLITIWAIQKEMLNKVLLRTRYSQHVPSVVLNTCSIASAVLGGTRYRRVSSVESPKTKSSRLSTVHEWNI